ncbi:hypothetical protein BT63DRAFT_465127 [Microthyrium microscopicum]|uniref:F-box domain-containing protein n=1 Tax=Microthyrium microscopicum TaxID=703497 RepID=A0A6A6TY55_9PEZI|nr:hypothetical protein BT63DRAFT_465127 [Microthyrium microscopicum]
MAQTQSEAALIASAGYGDPRYPPRKRAKVSYIEVEEFADYDTDVDVDDNDGDENDSPKKHVSRRKAATRGLTKRRGNQKEHGIFPFMKLPGEIRNLIYEFCLKIDPATPIDILHPGSTQPGKIRVLKRKQNSLAFLTNGPCDNSNSAFNYPDHVRVPHIISKVLVLNKAIALEASRFLYENTFNFCTPRAAQTFLAVIGPDNLRRITHVTFDRKSKSMISRQHEMFMAFVMLQPCVGIKSIVFAGYFPQPYSSKVILHAAENKWNMSFFASMIFEDCGSWYRSIALARRNIYAGLTVLTIRPRTYGFMIHSYLRNQAYSPAWIADFHAKTDQNVAMADCFEADMKLLLKKKLTFPHVDDQGNF